MGVFPHEYATPAAVAPARIYKAMVLEFHNLFPKIVEPIQSVEILEGNGDVGTIKKITVLEGGETKYVLHRIDGIDKAKLVYNYSIAGGTGLADTLEKISFETILVDGPNGGAIRKASVKYFTKGDAVVTEEELKVGQARIEALVKTVEGFLLANPDYN